MRGRENYWFSILALLPLLAYGEEKESYVIKVLPGDPRDEYCAKFFHERQERINKITEEIEWPNSHDFETGCTEAIGSNSTCACLSELSNGEVTFDTYAHYAMLSYEKLQEASVVGEKTNPFLRTILHMKEKCVLNVKK